MTTLVTSDLHVTDAPRDAYRWELFAWLRGLVLTHHVEDVLILGDLTDAKDRHSASLVNRLIEELHTLSEVVTVWLLKGNHDYIDEATPFFGFAGRLNNIVYAGEPSITTGIGGAACAFLPSTRNHEREWEGLDLSSCRWIFCHQTFTGALSENGTELSGTPAEYFDDLPKSCRVVSGDIHVPQTLHKGRITYVGSPYRVHFGDTFIPRVLLLDGNKMSDLHLPGVSRELVVARSVDEITALGFPRLTQVKVRLKLPRAEYPDWPRLREEIVGLAAEREWVLCGMELLSAEVKTVHSVSIDSAESDEVVRSPNEVVCEYAKVKNLDRETLDAGCVFVRNAR